MCAVVHLNAKPCRYCCPACRQWSRPAASERPVLLASSVPLPHPTQAGHFHWLSFFAFAGSVMFEGIRMVLTERVLGQVR